MRNPRTKKIYLQEPNDTCSEPELVATSLLNATVLISYRSSADIEVANHALSSSTAGSDIPNRYAVGLIFGRKEEEVTGAGHDSRFPGSATVYYVLTSSRVDILTDLQKAFYFGLAQKDFHIGLARDPRSVGQDAIRGTVHPVARFGPNSCLQILRCVGWLPFIGDGEVPELTVREKGIPFQRSAARFLGFALDRPTGAEQLEQKAVHYLAEALIGAGGLCLATAPLPAAYLGAPLLQRNNQVWGLVVANANDPCGQKPHGSALRKPSGALYVCQFTEDILDEIRDWCNEWGITFCIGRY